MKRGPKTKTHEEVESRLDGTGIHWVGRYVDGKTKVMFGCDHCGANWMAMPGSIFSGSRCAVCYNSSGRNRKGTTQILEDHGDWLVLDVSTAKMSDKKMLIDRVDYDRLSEFGKIGVSAYGYAILRINGKSTLLHRFIMDFPKEVDHINHDKLDNRRSNLRSVEAWQNQANRGMRKTNKSGVIGVDFHCGRWRAQLVVKGRTVLNKGFKDLDEAKAAYDSAVKEHRGEFAPQIVQEKPPLTNAELDGIYRMLCRDGGRIDGGPQFYEGRPVYPMWSRVSEEEKRLLRDP